MSIAWAPPTTEQPDRAALAIQSLHAAAKDLHRVTAIESDLCLLQAILAEARQAQIVLDDAVSALGWKVINLEARS